jgi:hypothetical protein
LVLVYSVLTPLCYDSFETIALVFIDNAVKYAVEASEIVVSVNDVGGKAVNVEVTSVGPAISDEMKTAIFLKGVRSSTARAFAPTGSGLGLTIAATVAVELHLLPGSPHDVGLLERRGGSVDLSDAAEELWRFATAQAQLFGPIGSDNRHSDGPSPTNTILPTTVRWRLERRQRLGAILVRRLDFASGLSFADNRT